MILQELLPRYHFSETHHLMTEARPSQLYASIFTMDLSSSPIVRLLYYVRRMPRASLTLNGMKAIGFTILGSTKDTEIVIGLVGRFWKPIPQIVDVPPERFAAFNETGYAKAAFNYLIEETGRRTRLSTETRIYCTSPGARLAFTAYWALIRPFSGLIRKAMLRDVARGANAYDARRCEKEAGQCADVPGFRKSATPDEARTHGHVLMPGRHIAAEAQDDDESPSRTGQTHLNFGPGVSGRR